MNAKVSWRTYVLLGVILGLLSIPGFSEGQDVVTVEDSLGRTVDVPVNIERIVGLEAGTLRMIVYLEATEMVAGVENIEKRDKKRPYRLAHPELKDLPSIGPMHGGDPELIVSVQPEVIFSTYTTRGKANDLQNKTGIPVVGLNYGDARSMTRADFYSSLRLMGKVLDKEKRAEEVIEFVESEIAGFREKTEGLEESGPSVYVGGIGYRGAHGITSTEPSYPPFSFLGVNNVADNLGLDHAMINEEKLVQWDPDYLFIDEAGLSLARKDLKEPQFRGLTAPESERVFGLLPYNYYTTNFGTVLADTYYIGKLIYPEEFGEIDPREEADRIYEFLVGEKVYSRMENIFGGFGRIEVDN